MSCCAVLGIVICCAVRCIVCMLCRAFLGCFVLCCDILCRAVILYAVLCVCCDVLGIVPCCAGCCVVLCCAVLGIVVVVSHVVLEHRKCLF